MESSFKYIITVKSGDASKLKRRLYGKENDIAFTFVSEYTCEVEKLTSSMLADLIDQEYVLYIVKEIQTWDTSKPIPLHLMGPGSYYGYESTITREILK